MAREPLVAVIDDDEPFRTALIESLDSLGYGARGFASAEEFVATDGEKSCDCVITDIHMPGSMDGLKLARAIRDRWPPIELILTSAFLKLAVRDLPERGVFLPKPYLPEALTEALHHFDGHH